MNVKIIEQKSVAKLMREELAKMRAERLEATERLRRCKRAMRQISAELKSNIDKQRAAILMRRINRIQAILLSEIDKLNPKDGFIGELN